MRKYNFKIAIILLVVLTPYKVFADRYEVALAEMPVHAISKTQGVQVDFVKAIEKLTNNQIIINLYPFARSISKVIKGQVDFHIPLIKNNLIPDEKLLYYHSSETIFNVNFVLYTIKGNGVTLKNLSQYRVETDRAHVAFFPFKTIPSSKIEQSLKKLNLGRIDAYIFADTSVDPVLKKLAFKNIQRMFYKEYEVKIILPRNKHGLLVDKMLTDAIKKLRASGKLQEIFSSVNQPYDNWQP